MRGLDENAMKRVVEILEHSARIENYYFVDKTPPPSSIPGHRLTVFDQGHEYAIAFSRTVARGSVFRHVTIANRSCECPASLELANPVLHAFGFVDRKPFHVEVKIFGPTVTAVQRLHPEEA